MDKITKAARSRNMAAVRSTDTKPELEVRSKIHREGFRFRLHVRDLPGRPDLVFRSFRIVVFVHGCFWHGHYCPRGKMPQTRREFWEKKLESNKLRDQRNIESLESMGWDVFVLWECQLEVDTENLIEELKSRRNKSA